MNVPQNCQYTESDEWVRDEAGVLTLGVTDYAQSELGEIVYLELPEVGASVSIGAPWGVVESVKAVAELLSPLDGEVLEVNAPLAIDPSLINSDAYGAGWMIRVRPATPPASLLSADEYATFRGLS